MSAGGPGTLSSPGRFPRDKTEAERQTEALERIADALDKIVDGAKLGGVFDRLTRAIERNAEATQNQRR